MIKNNLRSYADAVNSNINQNLDIITSIVYKYDIKNIIEQIKKLSDNEKDKVLEICINDCLSKIKAKKISDKLVRKLESDVDEIMEEASCVAFDLISKTIGHNNRKLELPINIDFIKTFCIHNMVKEKDIQVTVLFILLELSSVCYCLEHNNYSIDDN